MNALSDVSPLLPRRTAARALDLAQDLTESGEHLSDSARRDFERDVLMGLASERKSLPCKYFYDTRGSALFEQICQTPEYYVTRTEVALLKGVCPRVARILGPGVDVLEPGSGAGEKVRILLDSLTAPRSFVPIDISKSALARSVDALTRRYPDLYVHPLVADFTQPFQVPPHFFERRSSDLPQRSPTSQRKVIFFPGSTISNFDPNSARTFLETLRRVLSPGDFLFIGVDRVKDADVLHRAYNDEKGVTAAFNLNLLTRIRRELDTDLDPRTFRHHAFFNEARSRIEMHLVSDSAQAITISGRTFAFRRGESIHTENSYKYTIAGFTNLASRAGFRVDQAFSDPRDYFTLYLCRVPG